MKIKILTILILLIHTKKISNHREKPISIFQKIFLTKNEFNKKLNNKVWDARVSKYKIRIDCFN